MASEYEVAISCRNLANKDLLSKSNPMLILLEKKPQTSNYVERYRSEVMMNCLNPNFVKKFRLKRLPDEEDMMMRVVVIDIDNLDEINRIDKQEVIGRADFNRSELFANPTFNVSLRGNSGHVTFKTVRYDASLDGEVTLQLANHNFPLENRPAFLEIYRSDSAVSEEAGSDEEFTLLYRSEKSKNGDFKPIKVSLFSLTLGDTHRTLRLQLFHHSSNGDHKRLGTRDTSLQALKKFNVDSGAEPLLDFDCIGDREKKMQRLSLFVKQVCVPPIVVRTQMLNEYEVSISCHNLANKDLLSKSDPVAILLHNDPLQSDKFVELGRTELIMDCLNPNFVKKFRLKDGGNEDMTLLRVMVIDIDDFDHVDRLEGQDFIGQADFKLSQLFVNPTLHVPLSKKSGELMFKTVLYNPALDGRVTLQFANLDFPLKNRPAFLEIYRCDRPAMGEVIDEDFTLVYRSERTSTGQFESIQVSLFSLALGDKDCAFRVDMHRYARNGGHVRLGRRLTSLTELKTCASKSGEPRLLQFESCKAKSEQRFSLVLKMCLVCQ